MRFVAGEPTGTSTAFANKMDTAVRVYLHETGGAAELEKLTVMPLEGEGKVEDRVDRSVSALRSPRLSPRDAC